jgi:hypothetical protein
LQEKNSSNGQVRLFRLRGLGRLVAQLDEAKKHRENAAEYVSARAAKYFRNFFAGATA